MVPDPRPAGSALQTGGTAAQYWIGTAKVKRGSHILLGRRSHIALDSRSYKLLSRRSDTLIKRTSHMLLGRGRHTLNYKDAIQIWNTEINAIRMYIGEDIAQIEVQLVSHVT